MRYLLGVGYLNREYVDSLGSRVDMLGCMLIFDVGILVGFLFIKWVLYGVLVC